VRRAEAEEAVLAAAAAAAARATQVKGVGQGVAAGAAGAAASATTVHGKGEGLGGVGGGGADALPFVVPRRTGFAAAPAGLQAAASGKGSSAAVSSASAGGGVSAGQTSAPIAPADPISIALLSLEPAERAACVDAWLRELDGEGTGARGEAGAREAASGAELVARAPAAVLRAIADGLQKVASVGTGGAGAAAFAPQSQPQQRRRGGSGADDGASPPRVSPSDARAALVLHALVFPRLAGLRWRDAAYLAAVRKGVAAAAAGAV
jgi:hypothetical protein